MILEISLMCCMYLIVLLFYVGCKLYDHLLQIRVLNKVSRKMSFLVLSVI